MIAVAGCLPRLPGTFPLELEENSGNMIHARAPLRVLHDSPVVEEHLHPWQVTGEPRFADFVNKHCSHLIISMTNTMKTDNPGFGHRYARFQKTLELYDDHIPITIFGLGVRARSTRVEDAVLPPEGIELLRFMEQRCGPIGVRGTFTKEVFEHLAGVTNVQVTGCPSFFSEPEAFGRLRAELADPQPGVWTYSGTRFDRAEERVQLVRTIRRDGYYIEPNIRANHVAHLQAMRGEQVDPPDFLTEHGHVHVPGEEVEETRRGLARLRRPRGATPEPGPDQVTVDQLTEFYRDRYRLFRDPDEWLQFNREVVAFGFGTRFHVNMATMLAGKPATWITHDTRTQEFCDFLHLPHVTLADSAQMEAEDLRAAADYEPMFDNLHRLFDNWASYLEAHDLPYTRPRLP